MSDLCSEYNLRLESNTSGGEYFYPICLCEDGIARLRYKKVTLTMDGVRHLEDQMGQLQDNVLLPYIMDARIVEKMAMPALKHMWTAEFGKKFRHAVIITGRDDYGKYLLDMFKIYRFTASYEINFRVILETKNGIEKAKRWLGRRYSNDLIHKLLNLNEYDRVRLGRILSIHSESDTFRLMTMFMESESDNPDRKFLNEKLGDYDILQIMNHVSFIPELDRRIVRS